MTPPSVSILVLNYNGKHHLDECLGSLQRAAAAYAGSCAIVCVDNGSTDGSRDYVRDRYARVEVMQAPANDFLFSLNDVVRRRREEIVIIVNNDMRFDEGFVAPLVSHFERPDVFAVGSAIFDWEGASNTVGPRCACVEQFWFYKWWDYERQQAALTLEACGGAAAYRRRMFVELAGFDPLYRPGYYEDLDLSYRAWARGWLVVYEPCSRAYHRESASMLERFGDAAKAQLLYRNHLLFTVKNIGGAAFLAGFLVCLPYRVLSPLLRGYRVPLAGLLQALPRLPGALRKRFARSRGVADLSRFKDVMPVASSTIPRA
jgi:GT2 family glycosyltransferase